MKVKCTRCFKNLGVNSRVKLFTYIENTKESNVSELTGYLGLKQPTVSYHLKEMAKSGLLVKRISGKEVYYSVNHLCPYDGEGCVVNHI